jgi:hypothetical protein
MGEIKNLSEVLKKVLGTEKIELVLRSRDALTEKQRLRELIEFQLKLQCALNRELGRNLDKFYKL